MTDLATPFQVDDAAVLALEAIAARSWPATETERLGPWLLRAAEGWTGRANSALPTAVHTDLDAWLPAIEDWYRARGLCPTVAVPTPAFDDLEARLYAAGWEAGHGGEVLVAEVASLRAHASRTSGASGSPVADVEVLDAPDAAWMAAYHYRGGPLPAVAGPILRSAGAVFPRLVIGGETVAACRLAVEGRWAGIAAMEVAPRHRRQGLGRALLREVAGVAAARGVDALWLQVDPDNVAARALYRGLGFTCHHAYRYVRRGSRRD